MKNRIMLMLVKTARKYRVNQKYKDRVFRMIFHDKKDLLSLYNAINGTNYTDPDDLEIRTLDDAVYLGYKNDLSFLISNTLNLYEHQSTLNPNMPLRGLLYFTDMLKAYLEEKKCDIYGSKLVPVPGFLQWHRTYARYIGIESVRCIYEDSGCIHRKGNGRLHTYDSA